MAGSPRRRIVHRPCPSCGVPTSHVHPDEAVPVEVRNARTTPVPISLPMQDTKRFPVVDFGVTGDVATASGEGDEEPAADLDVALDRMFGGNR